MAAVALGGCATPPPAGPPLDLDRLVALCPPYHAHTDAPYVQGRLVITPRGGGRFTCEVIRGADEWAMRA